MMRNYQKNPQCVAITKKGVRCTVNAEPGSSMCHVHDPDGKYALQHPKYRQRQLDAMAKRELEAKAKRDQLTLI